MPFEVQCASDSYVRVVDNYDEAIALAVAHSRRNKDHILHVYGFERVVARVELFSCFSAVVSPELPAAALPAP